VRYRASFIVDAQSIGQALNLARDCMRPRAAPTRDGRPAEIMIWEEPAPPPPPGDMRWSWTSTDREDSSRDVTIAFEGRGRLARGVVSLYRRDAEPQVVAAYLAPGRVAELVRTLQHWPLDLMDRLALEDAQRRAAALAPDVAAFDLEKTHGGDE